MPVIWKGSTGCFCCRARCILLQRTRLANVGPSEEQARYEVHKRTYTNEEDSVADKTRPTQVDEDRLLEEFGTAGVP